MARPITLFTGQWADLPFEEVARLAGEWGFDGLEIACWGDHLDPVRAASDDDYVQDRLDILKRNGLEVFAIANHLTGQAVCDDPIDERHRDILTPEVWGDGEAEGVRQRAAEVMKATARAAARLGVGTVTGFTGSSIWKAVAMFPPASPAMIDAGYRDFAEWWNPILDVFEEVGVRFALEVHPSEIAYDYWTAKRTLEAIGHRECFGLNFDPSHFIWQDLDPVMFLQDFADKIFHVHVKESIRQLDGRNGRLSSHLPWADPRRGWTSSPPDMDMSSGSRSSGPSTRSATTVPQASSGKTPEWTASSGHPRPSNSSGASPGSHLQPPRSTPPSAAGDGTRRGGRPPSCSLARTLDNQAKETMTEKKTALVVRGGWDGHQPIEATELFIPFLKENGYDVRVEESPKIYADTEYMARVDLVVQCVTMSTIEKDEFEGLRAAVENGTGLAGWHGGIADSYRNNSDYLHLIGGQFACHPGKHPDERTGEQADNYVPYTVNMLSAAASHPVTAGIGDFELVTEQYWVLADDYIDVLATTTQKVREWDPWNREVTSPAIWTRQWGAGRIFVCTPGHRVEILQDTTVRTIIERGMLWASR